MLMPRSMKKYGAMPKNASTNRPGNDAQRQTDADHEAVHDGEHEPLAPTVVLERLADVDGSCPAVIIKAML